MKYAITITNANFDYGESNFIPKGEVVEIIESEPESEEAAQ